MSEHRATIRWQRNGTDFLKGKYSREHTWSFDGGLTVQASSSPSVVPLPFSNPTCVDPEEAFVASISSCHMLTFIWLASKRGFLIEGYTDEAVGTMVKDEKGVSWVGTVSLNPKIDFGGERGLTPQELEHLHHLAHEQCFIANSIKSQVVIR